MNRCSNECLLALLCEGPSPRCVTSLEMRHLPSLMKARRGVLEGRLGGFEERRKGLAERVAKLKAEAAECEKELQAAKRRGMSELAS